MSTVAGFQPMPDLTPEQYAALRADIEAHGIRVPITRDQHGRVIDGHNRLSIGTELGIVVPETRIHVADDDEAHEAALTLNCARRHLTGEQKRALIEAELERRPGDSNRAISRRVGCDHKTVASVRRGEIPTVDITKWVSPPWETPADVDPRIRLAAFANFHEWGTRPELPRNEAEAEWCRVAVFYDADVLLPLSVLLASDVDGIDLAVAVTSRMALWKSRGIAPRLLVSLFGWWIDAALSETYRATMRSDPTLKAMSDAVEAMDEGIEKYMDYLSAVPSMGSKCGAEIPGCVPAVAPVSA